jgi:hypothetical protein
MTHKDVYLVYAKIPDYIDGTQIISICTRKDLAKEIVEYYEFELDDYGIEGHVGIKKIPVNVRLNLEDL